MFYGALVDSADVIDNWNTVYNRIAIRSSAMISDLGMAVQSLMTTVDATIVVPNSMMTALNQRVLIALSLRKVHEEQLHKSVDKHGSLLYKIPPFCRRGSRSCRRPFSTRRFVKKHRAQIVSSAFKFMNETNPTVETHVWNSIVLVQKQITDWSGHLNFDKIVFPMLWKVLKSGASGSSGVRFSAHVVTGSKFAREVLKDRTDKFHTLFFEKRNRNFQQRLDRATQRTQRQLAQRAPLQDELHTLVYTICRLYFDRITLTRDQAYVLNPENLVRQFQCVETFQFLAGPGQPIGALFDSFSGT
ncbi:hypothetical protein quinque_000275 [Culex quinquefasciatus]